jgi:RIO-like serine/threonine protein kinase
MKGTTNKETKLYEHLVQSVVFKRYKEEVLVLSFDKTHLSIIGSGRSAYVFKLEGTNRALKVFYSPHEHLAKKEAEIYDKLKGIPSFPELYESGDDYIVIDFIEGHTIFECLVKGIHINGKVLEEVDRSIAKARQLGLNPSDIHLHNILLTTDGEVKLIDVVRFDQIKHCTQWEDLKRAYHKFYKKRLFPKKLPHKLLLLIAYFYKRNLLKRFIS